MRGEDKLSTRGSGQQLSSAAFTVVRPLTRSDSAQVDFMLLADPDGFLVELQQDRREMYRK